MKRKPGPPEAELVFQRWQHLEFFQWFAATFHATRTKDHPTFIKREETFKCIPHGIAVSYHKLRGAELFYQKIRTITILSAGQPARSESNADWTSLSSLPTDALFIRMGLKQPHAIPPTLDGRLILWRRRLEETLTLDFRQQTALAAILSYQPNPIHPSRR